MDRWSRQALPRMAPTTERDDQVPEMRSPVGTRACMVKLAKEPKRRGSHFRPRVRTKRWIHPPTIQNDYETDTRKQSPLQWKKKRKGPHVSESTRHAYPVRTQTTTRLAGLGALHPSADNNRLCVNPPAVRQKHRVIAEAGCKP